MLMKIYALIWILLVVGAAMLTATFGLTEPVVTALGLVFSTLFFAGVFAILPWQMERHYSRHQHLEQPIVTKHGRGRSKAREVVRRKDAESGMQSSIITRGRLAYR
jgi:hypothetical protein